MKDYCILSEKCIKFNTSGLSHGDSSAGINKIESVWGESDKRGGSRPLDYLDMYPVHWENVNIPGMGVLRGGCMHGGQASQTTQLPFGEHYGILQANITVPVIEGDGSRLKT